MRSGGEWWRLNWPARARSEQSSFNQVSSESVGPVVQAGVLNGGVHLHQGDGSVMTPLDRVRQDVDSIVAHVDLARFTGRAWLTRQVDEFLTRHARGFVWVEAEAGLGKTTYAAHLARTRGYLSHFTRLPGGTRPAAALRNLAAQLIETHESGTGVPDWAETPEGFASLLRRAAERSGGPVVIVVDGLDEAQDSEGFALGLPKVLPNGVYVIGTYRTGRPPDRPDSPYTTVRIEQRGEDNRADVAAYLTTVAERDDIAAQLREHDVTPQDFVAALAERCDGVWVYLTYVLEEIRLGLRTVADVRSLPADVLDYYTATVDRWRTDPAWATTRLPVLTTLAAAAEPLALDILAEFAGVPDRHVVRELCDVTLRPLLAVTGSGAGRYAIYHAGFREFLHGTLPPRADAHPDGRRARASELADHTRVAHGRIGDVFLSRFGGLPNGLPVLARDPSAAGAHHDYSHRHLAHHLVQAGRSEDLHRLLACEHRADDTAPAVNVWYACHEYAGTMDAYLDDLERAGDAVHRSATGLGAEVRYALMAAGVRSMSGNVDPALVPRLLEAGVWSVDRAVTHTRTQHDPVRRASTAALVAPHVPVERRQALLDDAIDAVRATGDLDSRAWAVLMLAPQLASGTRARAVTEVLTDLRADTLTDHRRADVLGAVVPYLQPAQLDTALSVATGIAQAEYRVEALTWLVPHLPVKLRDRAITDALSAISDIEPPRVRAEVLAVLAPCLAPGHHDTALGHARAITDDGDRLNALVGLLPYLADDQRSAILREMRVRPRLAGYYITGRLALVLTGLRPEVTAETVSEAVLAARAFARTIAALPDGAPTDSPPWSALPADRLRAALAAAEVVDGLPYSGQLLAELLHHLDDDGRKSVTAAAEMVSDVRLRAEVLAATLPYLDAARLAQAAVTQVPGQKWSASIHREVPTLVLLFLAEQVTADRMRQSLDDAARHSDRLFGHRSADVERRWFGPRRTPRASVDRPNTNLPAGLEVDQLRAVLAAAEAIDGSPLDDRALAALWPFLRVETRRSVESAAQAIQDASLRSKVLITLFPYLDDDQLVRAVERVLAALAVDYGGRNAMPLLLRLGAHVSADILRQSVDEVLSSTWVGTGREAVKKRWLDRTVTAGTPFGSAKERLHAMLAAGGAVDDLPQRQAALADLSSHLPETERTPAIEREPAVDSTDDRSAHPHGTVAPPDADERLRAALADVLDMANPMRGLDRLSELAPQLPTEPAIDAFRATQHCNARTEQLAVLAERLPEDVARSVRKWALAAPYQRRDSAHSTAAGLIEQAPPAFADELRTCLPSAEAVNRHAETLASLVTRLPDDVRAEARDHYLAAPHTLFGAHVLAQLSPELSPDQLDTALAAALAATSPDDRTTLLAALAPWLPRRQLDAVVSDGDLLDAGAELLADLVPHLSPAHHEALRARAEKSFAKGKGFVPAVLMSALAPYVPVHQRADLLDNALIALHRAYDQMCQLGLSGVAKGLLRRAADLSSTAQTPSEKAAAHEFWRTMLRNRTRPECLDVITAMSAWLAAQGDSAEIKACVEAIEDVGRWWP